MTRVDVIIPCWNHLDATTAPCIASVLAETRVPFRIIAVDNGSRDRTGAWLDDLATRDERVVVERRHANEGWDGGTLAGLARVDGQTTHLCLLNSDTVVTTGWLGRMLACLERPPAPTVVIPVEDDPPEQSPVRLPIAPGSRVRRRTIDRDAIRREGARRADEEAGRSREAAPSGFCLLLRASDRDRLEDYLRSFRAFRDDPDRDAWYRWWQRSGATCRVALDAYVWHARGGSGGYYDSED